MKYVIFRANCAFSDGSTITIQYNENVVTKKNACNDVNEFRARLKNELNTSLQTLGITVVSIALTYEERDSRQ